MSATSAWLASVEAILNRNIAASTRAAALCRRLEATTLQVEVSGLTRVRASVRAGRLGLLAGEDSPADAVILGSAPALLRAFRDASPANGARGSLQIRGDAEIADLYRELLAAARPDLEEELSRFIGDIPARHLSLVAKSVRTWAQRSRRIARENMAEFLQEEGRDLVTSTELQEFLRGVDEVREAADRMEARLSGLEQRARGLL